MLQFYIPEVVSVEQIFDEADKVLSISNFDHIKAIHVFFTHIVALSFTSSLLHCLLHHHRCFVFFISTIALSFSSAPLHCLFHHHRNTFLLQGGAGRACQVGRKDWNEGRPLIETILSVSVKRDSSDIKVTLSENICICTLDWMSDLSTEAAFALT